VEERKTAGRAEPTEREGSKPAVRTAVEGRCLRPEVDMA
jgi:hypothetical protein